MIFKQMISALKQERLAITGSAKLVQFENFFPACKASIVNNSSYSSYLFFLIFLALLSVPIVTWSLQFYLAGVSSLINPEKFWIV